MMSQPEMPSTHVGNVTQESPQAKPRGRDLYKCETTSDGDVRTFVVEPSFDADENASRHIDGGIEKDPERNPTCQDAQSRSDEDDQESSEPLEKRSSPSKDKDDRVHTHSRNLSAHFFDATKIRDDDPQSETVPSLQGSFPVQHSSAMHTKQASFSSSSPTFSSTVPLRGSATPTTEGAISYSMRARPPPISPAAAHVGEKHRRGISGDMSSPAVAHRRINSIGNSAPVDRRGYYYHYNGAYHNAPQDRSGGFPVPASREPSTGAHHHREDSAGLDMLSAAIADVSKEELAVVAGPREREGPTQTPWEPPVDSSNRAGRRTPMETLRVSPTSGSSGQYEYPPQGGPQGPPPRNHGYHPTSHPPQQGFHGSSSPTSHGPPYAPGPYHHHGSYYHPPRYHHRGMSSSPTMQQYPVQYSQPRTGNDPYNKPQHMPLQPVLSRNSSMAPNERRPSPSELNDKIDTDERLFMRGSPPSTVPPPGGTWHRPVSRGGTTTGSQTHVTAISVGDDGRTIQPSAPQRNACTNTDPMANDIHPPQSIPSTVGHHRKMSSFSSLGTLMNSGLFSDAGDNQSAAPPTPHHRTMSSTTSFLQVLDESDPFLQSLSAPPPSSGQTPQSYAPQPNRYTSSPTSSQSPNYNAPPPAETSSNGGTQFSGRALASGGTSKRIRRKCTIAGCPNRVVQGGLCISHGAKRKQCKHPGCTKNVKKAGLCSTHGPARKRCDTEGCTKVAVQGGKCIAHGAKKKLCAIEGCTKQAILAGMCKKHHDQQRGVVSSRSGRKSSSANSSGRGSDGSASPPLCAGADEHSKQGSTPEMKSSSSIPKSNHRRGLSIFQEMSADSVKILLSDGNDAEEGGPQPGDDAFTPF